jgi:hypothetical protein
MLTQSQPLDPSFCERMGLDKADEELEFSEKKSRNNILDTCLTIF